MKQPKTPDKPAKHTKSTPLGDEAHRKLRILSAFLGHTSMADTVGPACDALAEKLGISLKPKGERS